jgi:hypothetical protein
MVRKSSWNRGLADNNVCAMRTGHIGKNLKSIIWPSFVAPSRFPEEIGIMPQISS